jgi:phosphate/sulfate permease
MWTLAIFVATVFLAYANGANDNFKGVATLFGSKTTNYKVAIWWATATTFAGSLCSIILADALLKSFSGKGLVPDAIADTSSFHLAVAFGAAMTVILATITGFPLGMAIGGLLNARKVAMTMSNKITTLNPGQGLAANLVTSFLVIFASRLGVPVSTTHVSVGSIFGVGVVSKTANLGVFSKVLSSWVLTLPIAAMISGIIYLILPQ